MSEPDREGRATGCKPPCGERRESAPGSERDTDALRLGPVTGPLSEKKEWNRDTALSPLDLLYEVERLF